MSTKPEIIEEQQVPGYEVKQEIAKIKKRDEELNFRVQKTEEYLNTFIDLSAKQGKELVGKLRKLKIPRLNDGHIYKLVDILPATLEELKVMMQGYTLTINNDNMKKIVKVVSDYVPESAK